MRRVNTSSRSAAGAVSAMVIGPLRVLIIPRTNRRSAIRHLRRRIFVKNLTTAASLVAVIQYRDGRPGVTARPRSQDRTIFRNAGNAGPFALPYTSGLAVLLRAG